MELGGILERLNGTVAQVSKLRQSLADIEIELLEIRQACEDAHAATHDGSRNAIIQDTHERDSGTEGDRRVETPKSKMKREPKGHSPLPSSSRIPGGSGSPEERVVKSGNCLAPSNSQIRPTPAQPQVQGVAPLGPVRKHTTKPPTPSPFPQNLKPSPYPPELKHKGPGWFVLFNPSPKVKRVLDVNVVHTLKHDSDVWCVKFSQDGKWLATGCRKMAQIYDVETGVKACTLHHENSKYINSVAFSPDGKYLVTGGGDPLIRVWDIANQKIHDTLKGHQHTVYSLHFSPNGQFLISGSLDGTVRIWDMHNKTFKILIIDGHYLIPEHLVRSVAVSPDGRYVAVGSVDTVVSIWEIATGVQVQTLRGHTRVVGSVAFTPDGKGLISGSWDATLKYWDISGLGIGIGASTARASTSSSPCIMNLLGHRRSINSVALSHDGTWIVSGSHDRSVLFWDTRTGVAQCLLVGHKDTVWKVNLSPVGNVLATASQDGQVRIWSYGPCQ